MTKKKKKQRKKKNNERKRGKKEKKENKQGEVCFKFLGSGHEEEEGFAF